MGKLASALGRHGGDVSSTLSVRQMIGGDFLTGLTAGAGAVRNSLHFPPFVRPLDSVDDAIISALYWTRQI